MKKLTIISLQKTGAAAVDTLELSSALCKKKIFHTLIIASKNELLKYYLENPFRRIERVETFESNNISFFIATFTIFRPLKLLYVLTKTRSDIYFSTHFHPWLIIVYLASLLKKTTWKYSTHESPYITKEKRGYISTQLEKIYLCLSDDIYCYSNFIYKSLKNNLLKKIIVLPLGAYKESYKIIENLSLINIQKEQRKVRFVYVGRIVPHKGIGDLYEVAKMLTKKTADFEITIAGKGKLPKHNESNSSIKIINKWLTFEEIGKLIASTDIVVLPYTMASQSGIASWALAASKPIVAYNVGGLEDQIRNNISGILVEPKNINALCETLFTLIQKPNTINMMSKNTIKLSEYEITWERAVDIIMNDIKYKQ